MTFLLDTNICSAYLRRPGNLAHRLVQHAGRLAIPSIVLGELWVGAYHHQNSERLLRGIQDLLGDFSVLPFDEVCARQFGELRGNLMRAGLSISAIDAMIAATAIVNDLTLITHNVRHFTNVPDLRIEDWLAT